MIELTNSLTRHKEPFKPEQDGLVKMYTCGPTVYDYVHIGNIRAFLTADVARRVFEASGFLVTHVMNVTDVGLLSNDDENGEDKMIKGLKREGKPITLSAMRELADFYTERFTEDITRLNIKLPSVMPKASEHITEDIELIATLEKKGFTYQTSDGIYFDTSKDADYGALGGISDDQHTHARIEENTEKKSRRDFALWKFNSELGFESPWGKGFPGWHIECSAMSRKYLGEHFDIHTGGSDLASIHHNNEIAQSESAYGAPYVRYWLHNAFVNFSGGKMAKSVGNVITLRTLEDEGFDPLSYRYWLLTAHYRSPVEFSFEALKASETAFLKLKEFVTALPDGGEVHSDYQARFLNIIQNDLDTASAIALAWELTKDKAIRDSDKKATLVVFDSVFGLKLDEKITINPLPEEVMRLRDEREKARAEKNWKRSDELRTEIQNLGYEVNDSEHGTTIKKASRG